MSANSQTASAATDVKPSAIVGIILLKSDDVFYNPVIYSVMENGRIECRTTVNGTSSSSSRSYTFQVFYLPSLNI